MELENAFSPSSSSPLSVNLAQLAVLLSSRLEAERRRQRFKNYSLANNETTTSMCAILQKPFRNPTKKGVKCVHIGLCLMRHGNSVRC